MARHFGKRTHFKRFFGRVGHATKVGIRKIKNVTNKITHHASKAGKLVELAGNVSGNPELSAAGAGITRTSDATRTAANTAFNVSKGIEKVVRGDKSGVAEVFEGGKKLQAQFES